MKLVKVLFAMHGKQTLCTLVQLLCYQNNSWFVTAAGGSLLLPDLYFELLKQVQYTNTDISPRKSVPISNFNLE